MHLGIINLIIQSIMKIYLLAAISFLVGTAEYIIAGILDQISVDLHLSVSMVGQMITIFSIAFAVGTPAIIAITGKWDRKQLLIIALIIFALANVVTLWMESFLAINIARAISGVSAGVIEVIALVIAAKLAAPEKKGSAIAMIIIGFSMALVVGVPLGRLISSIVNWRFIFLGIGVLAILFLLAILYAIPAVHGDKPVPLTQQFAVLKNKNIAILFAITFLWISAFSIIYSYISPYLLMVSHVNADEISQILLVCGLASLIGSKMGGWATDKFSYSTAIIGGFLLHAGALIFLALLGFSISTIYLLLFVWSMAAWSSGPALQYKLISLAPESTNIIFSLYTAFIQFGMAFGAIAGGLVIDLNAIHILPILAAVNVLISLSLLFLVMKMKDRKQLVTN